jgi:hypothetical protein
MKEEMHEDKTFYYLEIVRQKPNGKKFIPKIKREFIYMIFTMKGSILS